MPQMLSTVEVQDEPGVYHIPGVHNLQNTLCGFVDVSWSADRDAEEFPCNCEKCIDALAKIKALRFPKYYFAKIR
ncbi:MULTISPECIES: hypothetical protein [Herbaspirillum]|uniref:Uncharacterized protein n=1 Tax=Herbaspirillum huttiense TaxID=863372 RepID=A0AAJ2HB47_9BURK|nr:MULTISPECIES: hypothetical protein [Herbaspirillum]MDR9836860.1 hypothetical protein [Herbaspirillum huttiense]